MRNKKDSSSIIIMNIKSDFDDNYKNQDRNRKNKLSFVDSKLWYKSQNHLFLI